MVVRLVRAGVGALLLLIAVPLALAGGGLWVAMEHRAADDTFTARLERLRSGGRAVVVPDIDALLRADAPFARGGQTTLSLSAVGSSGPLFIGLAPEASVQRYLDGLVQARVSRVRLARGPLPVELTEVETRAAAASAGATAGRQADPGAGAQTAGPVQGGPAVAGPGTDLGSGDGTGGTADPNAGDPNAGNPGGAADPNATTGGDQGATTIGPNATTGDPNTNPGDPNASPADPNATPGPNATNDPNATTGPSATGAGSGDAAGGGTAVPLGAPAGQEFWLAESVTAGGVARLTWSPSALRGRHLALVVMNADGTAGINATVTARLAPAWIGPTAGGLLMLGTALFLLALLILAWPPRRAEERLVLPTLPSQPAKGRGRASLRRNLSTLSDPIAALLNPVVPKNRDTGPPKNLDVATAESLDVATAESLDVATAESLDVATAESLDVATAESLDVATAENLGAAMAGNLDVATAENRDAAPVAVTIEVTRQTEVEDDRQTTTVGVVVTEERPAEAAAEPADEAGPQVEALAESELDRPALAAGIDDDEPGPVVLPPLPKLPAIELQFTWAPVAVDEQEEATTSS
ncbi:hypothetical protein OHA72_15340 [Dactylosporangium sp. NBC_01737]|uniref:hypothetical protein n=1 Tax=Dactylosporangium sp. NBC_01737 TaxID=2975959 RepID=UPI002E0EA47D|nr:hypothetical protein OHA72_15340 [Dactylosporangium sp. NBC_01737]